MTRSAADIFYTVPALDRTIFSETGNNGHRVMADLLLLNSLQWESRWGGETNETALFQISDRSSKNSGAVPNH